MRLRCAGCTQPILDLNSLFGYNIKIEISCSECGCTTTTEIGYVKNPELSMPKEAQQRSISPYHPANISTLLIFTKTFDALYQNGNDVEEFDFIKKLKLAGIDPKEAKEMIKKAMQNGHIFERRPGYYAKA